MTMTEKINMLNILAGESLSESMASAYLTLAGQKILQKAFPFDHTQTRVPERYELLQLEIAAHMYLKRGAEGETSHSENGVSRHYETASVPDSMLKQVIPHAKVVSGD